MSLILDGTTGVPVTTVTGTLPVANGGTGVTTAIDYGFKNRIINGSMVIDQRNAGASVTVNSNSQYFYDVDRFYGIGQSTDGVFTLQQNTSVPTGQGFVNSMKVTITTADASIGATQYYWIAQEVEGYNVADLQYGTANAKTVTLSFWVNCSVTGTFSGCFMNSASNRSYPFTYTISTANTWEQKTITIAGDTTGTWLTTNGIGISVQWSLGSGSTYSGTAGAWAGARYHGATGATALISTLSATLYITGVQLEKGSTATSFDYRPYGTELALCQRYYEKSFNIATAPVQNAGVGTGENTFPQPVAASTGTFALFTPFKVTKNSSPTVTVYNPAAANAQIRNETTSADWTGSAAENQNQSGFAITGTTPAGTGVGQKNGFHWTASAEL